MRFLSPLPARAMRCSVPWRHSVRWQCMPGLRARLSAYGWACTRASRWPHRRVMWAWTCIVRRAPGDPPFKGLQYFDEDDAEWFFGREELTAELVKRLRGPQSLAVIIGASGSGKSSLVRAGVIPKIKKAMQGNRRNEGAGGRV